MYGPHSEQNRQLQEAKRNAALNALQLDPIGSAERQNKNDLAFWDAEGQAKAGSARAAVTAAGDGNNEAAARPQQAALKALEEAAQTGRQDSVNVTAERMNSNDNVTRGYVADKDATTRVGVANIGAAADVHGYNAREREGKYATDAGVKNTQTEVAGRTGVANIGARSNEKVAGIDAGARTQAAKFGAFGNIGGSSNFDQSNGHGPLYNTLFPETVKPGSGAPGGGGSGERDEGQVHPTNPEFVWSSVEDAWVKKTGNVATQGSFTPTKYGGR